MECSHASRFRRCARVVDSALFVGAVSLLPIREPRNSISVYAANNPPATPADDEFAYVRSALPGYFAAMRIPLVACRDIESSDRNGTAQVMVINQNMAGRLFPDRSPLGQNVVVDLLGPTLMLRVVGV